MASPIKKLYDNFYIGTLDPNKSTFALPLNSLYLNSLSGKFYRAEIKGKFKAIIDVDNGTATATTASGVSEDYKQFNGNGSTKTFDCELNIAVCRVDVDGYVVNPDDFSKEDDTKVVFNVAPADGAEITVWIVS